MPDHNEAMRLAGELVAPIGTQTSYQTAHEAAALLRKQAERIAELEAERAEIIQAITDPENQPSQYGTVTLEYLSDKLKEWERRWFERDQQADKAEAERDTLRAEVQRLKPNAERWEYALSSEEFAICQWGEVFGEPCWVPISEESAIDLARTTHKETE